MYLMAAYLTQAYLQVVDPVITTPPAIYPGEKASLSLSRGALAALEVVQNHPVFSEQASWERVQAIYINEAIPFGDTDRIVGVRFRGPTAMTGRFKADAEPGDTYVMARIFIRGSGQRLRISRSDLQDPTALDFTIS